MLLLVGQWRNFEDPNGGTHHDLQCLTDAGWAVKVSLSNGTKFRLVLKLTCELIFHCSFCKLLLSSGLNKLVPRHRGG